MIKITTILQVVNQKNGYDVMVFISRVKRGKFGGKEQNETEEC